MLPLSLFIPSSTGPVTTAETVFDALLARLKNESLKTTISPNSLLTPLKQVIFTSVDPRSHFEKIGIEQTYSPLPNNSAKLKIEEFSVIQLKPNTTVFNSSEKLYRFKGMILSNEQVVSTDNLTYLKKSLVYFLNESNGPCHLSVAENQSHTALFSSNCSDIHGAKQIAESMIAFIQSI